MTHIISKGRLGNVVFQQETISIKHSINTINTFGRSSQLFLPDTFTGFVSWFVKIRRHGFLCHTDMSISVFVITESNVTELV